MKELKRLALLLIGGAAITYGVSIFLQRAGERPASAAFEVPSGTGGFFASRPMKPGERAPQVARVN